MRMPSLLASAVLCSAALSAAAAPATSPRQSSESRMLRGAAAAPVAQKVEENVIEGEYSVVDKRPAAISLQ